jgi:arylsulfatase A-like enzyme
MILLIATLCAACHPDGRAPAGEAEAPLPKAKPAARAERVKPVKPAPAPEPLAPVEPAHHAVFSLADNRFLAHPSEQGGLVASLGMPWGAKYTWGGFPNAWALHRSVEDVEVAIPRGNRTELEVPLGAEQAANAEQLTLRLWSPVAGQRVTAWLNGTSLDEQTLEEPGWHTVRWPLSDDVARAGENTVRVRFAKEGTVADLRSGAGLASLAIGPASMAAEPTRQLAMLEAASPGSLYLMAGTGLTYHVMAPQEGRLAAMVQAPAACTLTARAMAGGRLVGEAVVRGAGLEPVPLRLAFGEDAGRVVRLELRVDASEGCSGAGLIDAALEMPGEAPQAPTEVPAPKHVIIWMVDTLRADHLPLFNPKTDVSAPAFQRLASRAVVFERAYSQGNESKVSHASLFSGLYPIRHGHLRGSTSLGEELELMPEAMQRAGYATAGVIANGFISEPWGFVQGWDSFRNTLRDGGGISGEQVLARGFKWLDAQDLKQSKQFLYMGTIDPHVTYRRHPDLIDQYDPDDKAWRGTSLEDRCSGVMLDKIAVGEVEVGDAERARIRALYKNEVAFSDRQLGALLDGLEARGILDETMIIVTSDHGEELWERGKVGHARGLQEEQTWVPLIVHYPPLFPAGKRVAEGVDVLDVLPTLLDAAGATIPEELQGESLVGLANGVGQGYPRPSIATHFNTRYSLRMGGFKVIKPRNKPARFYDLVRDPGELAPLEGRSHAVVQRWLIDALATFVARDATWNKRRDGVASNLRGG